MMDDFTYEAYALHPSLTRGGQISFTISPLDGEGKAALDCSNRLLYVVTYGSAFLYVGEAKGKLKTRLRRGFTAYRHYERTQKARGGYKGYKWIEPFAKEQEVFTVHSFIFPEHYDAPEQRAAIEAVEGELVYLIRRHQGKWPLHQNEIHFSNVTGSSSAAEKAYGIITNNIE